MSVRPVITKNIKEISDSVLLRDSGGKPTKGEGNKKQNTFTNEESRPAARHSVTVTRDTVTEPPECGGVTRDSAALRRRPH